MRKEEDCKPQEKFLIADELFSDETIQIWKNESKKRLKIKHKGELFDKFIHWNPKVNEVALFTSHAYADFKIPKKFDCLFNTENPSEYVFLNFILTQSIYEAWFPSDLVEHGHNHLSIFEFENEIPVILGKLHIAKGKNYESIKDRFSIGICNSGDFIQIRKNIEKILLLKEKHGHKWWEYYEKE